MMIDLCDDPKASPLHFRRVLAPQPSPASVLLVDRRLGWMRPEEKAAATAVEISAQSMFYAQVGGLI